jgi:hypothetical protein
MQTNEMCHESRRRDQDLNPSVKAYAVSGLVLIQGSNPRLSLLRKHRDYSERRWTKQTETLSTQPLSR